MTEPLSAASAKGAPIHGGDLAAATQRFGVSAEGWLDLSTGINPVAYPFQQPPPEVSARLPAPDAEAALADVARAYYGTEAAVVIGAGSQAFIQTLPRLRPVGRVAVISPTYSEHARAWTAAGHDVHQVRPGVDLAGFDVVVVVNPNNPDGRQIEAETLIALADHLHAHGRWLVVDEAFADADPDHSVAAQAGRGGLIVLRSFGKFFGLAGVRLGFALCADDMAAELQRNLGPWPVSGPALHIGRQALGDRAWHAQTRRQRHADKQRLDKLLRDAGHKIIGGTALFRLVETDGPGLHRHLAQHGIWTRAFDFSPHLLRLGLAGEETAWQRLTNALSALPYGNYERDS
jgi:cobalamin biosynthesis protein CobC